MSKHKRKVDRSTHPFQVFARDCKDREWNGCCLYICKARVIYNIIGMTTVSSNPSCDGRKCAKWKKKRKRNANRTKSIQKR